MADGHLLYGADGHLLRNADGHLVHTCPKAVEWGEDCEYCEEGQTPKYVTVTFSGLTATYDNDCHWGRKSFVDCLDGSYTLTQVGDACSWRRYQEGDFGHGEVYLGTYPNCETLQHSYAAIALDIELFRNYDDSWSLTAEFIWDNESDPPGYYILPGSGLVFVVHGVPDEEPSHPPCGATSGSAANTVAAWEDYSDGPIQGGGSVTIEGGLGPP